MTPWSLSYDTFFFILCLSRYEWQGKIEEDSEVLLVSADCNILGFQSA